MALAALPDVLGLLASGDLDVPVAAVPLADVEQDWRQPVRGRRTVVRP